LATPHQRTGYPSRTGRRSDRGESCWPREQPLREKRAAGYRPESPLVKRIACRGQRRAPGWLGRVARARGVPRAGRRGEPWRGPGGRLPHPGSGLTGLDASRGRGTRGERQ